MPKRDKAIMPTHRDGLTHGTLAPGPLRLARVYYAKDHIKMVHDFLALAARQEDDEPALPVPLQQAVPATDQERKRYKRGMRKAARGQGCCTLCGTRAAFGLAGMWVDPLHLERPALYYLLYYACSVLDYHEAMNARHRQYWQHQHSHGAERPPEPDQHLLRR